MQLNSKGVLAKFYMWLPPDDKKLPQDFCTYFWGLVGRTCFVALLGGAVVAGLVSLIYWVTRFVFWFSLFIWAHKIPALVTLVSALIVALAIWSQKREKKIKIEILIEAKTIIRGKIDAVKNRYCPRIEWKSGNAPTPPVV